MIHRRMNKLQIILPPFHILATVPKCQIALFYNIMRFVRVINLLPGVYYILRFEFDMPNYCNHKSWTASLLALSLPSLLKFSTTAPYGSCTSGYHMRARKFPSIIIGRSAMMHSQHPAKAAIIDVKKCFLCNAYFMDSNIDMWKRALFWPGTPGQKSGLFYRKFLKDQYRWNGCGIPKKTWPNVIACLRFAGSLQGLRICWFHLYLLPQRYTSSWEFRCW